MTHQMPSTSGSEVVVDLDKRLQSLDDVDRKIGEILEATKEIVANLEKDKQISKPKMDEAVKKFTKSLEDDVFRIINEQLNYMDQLCVGSEHQGSMFYPQDRRETSRQSLRTLHKELEALVPSKEAVEKETDADANMSDEDNDSSFEDVVSAASSG